MSVKKAKEQLDSQFHLYLPQEIDHPGANLDEPEAQIILDSLMGKDAPEKVL